MVVHDSKIEAGAEGLCQRITLKIWESCICYSCHWNGRFGGARHLQMVICIPHTSMTYPGDCDTVVNGNDLPSCLFFLTKQMSQKAYYINRERNITLMVSGSLLI